MHRISFDGHVFLNSSELNWGVKLSRQITAWLNVNLKFCLQKKMTLSLLRETFLPSLWLIISASKYDVHCFFKTCLIAKLLLHFRSVNWHLTCFKHCLAEAWKENVQILQVSVIDFALILHLQFERKTTPRSNLSNFDNFFLTGSWKGIFRQLL